MVTTSRALACSFALLCAFAFPLSGQTTAAPQDRIPGRFGAPVRITLDPASRVSWVTSTPGRQPWPDAHVRPDTNALWDVLEGTRLADRGTDTLRLHVVVFATDSSSGTTGSSQWVTSVPWSVVQRVEVREDDEAAIRARGRRGGFTGFALGAAIGALVGGDNRPASAVGGGAVLGLFGYILVAQGASVSTPPCWRLVYEREEAIRRAAAGEVQHFGGTGPLECPGRAR
jgi:hypothetical protein